MARLLPRTVAATLTVVALAVCPTTPAVSAPAPDPSRPTAGATPAPVDQVVVISVDGLNPRALARTGRRGTPALHRLLRTGAGTRNARSAVELTLTLPNHTGMVTGRPIDPALGGHGVTWNDDRTVPATVTEAAGAPVLSVFDVVDRAGRSTALFASKTKFSLWQRSWPDALDRVRIDENNVALTRAFNRDVAKRRRALRFLHLSLPDRVGHEHGFMSPRYLRAVRRVDRMVDRVLRTIRRDAHGRTSVVLTSDHGGRGPTHGDATALVNQRVLFVARGPGIARGEGLYALNDWYRNPGRRQPAYTAKRPPVRNADAANLALALLGLPAVPGSRIGANQNLVVTPFR